MELLKIAAWGFLIFLVGAPMVSWWLDRSSYKRPPEGISKEEWEKTINANVDRSGNSG